MGKKAKGLQIKTKNFCADQIHGEFGKPWKVKKKTGKKEYSDYIGTILFSEKDMYKCCEMFISMDEELTASEYVELLEAIVDYKFDNEESEFVRVRRELAEPGELRTALSQIGFDIDPVDEAFLIKQKEPTNWIAIYMCLGVSIGCALGTANNNMSIGMCIGIAIGVMLGSALTSSAKKKQEELNRARIAGEPPVLDEE